jgi:F-BAR domain only protein
VKKSSFGGIKRGLGTVIGRRKSQAPLPPGVPEKDKKKGTRSSFAPFRRGDSSQNFQDLERTGRDLTPVVSREPQRPPPQLREQSFERSIAEEPVSRDGAPDGEHTVAHPKPTLSRDLRSPNSSATVPALSGASRPTTNGNMDGAGAPAETFHPPPGPPPSHTRPPQELSTVPATPEGASPTPVYPSTTSPIDGAFPSSPETEESAARNLMIRDQPIPEDETEAQKAMSNMANQLRMQAPMARVQGSARGRRDVRNTMFVPNMPEATNNAGGITTTAAIGAGVAAGVAAGAVAGAGAMDLASPIKQPSTPGTIPEDRAVSDTASLHSSQSLANVAQHPVMEGLGLNASIIETVSTWFTEGSINRSFVVGEIALAINGLPEDDTETIRLSNFQILEKVAANPTFVHAAISDKGKEKENEAGEYTIDVNAIRKSTPTVALKYQVHLEAEVVAAYSPVLVTPAWRCQQGQVSVIVLYALNPSFIGASSGEVTLKNVVITVSLDNSDGTKATGAMMSPTQGASFKRKAGAVVWRMNELKISGTEQEKLLVRFTTNTPAEGTPKKGTVEAKWEYEQTAAGTAQQLGVTRLVEGEAGEEDPFADEGEAAKAAKNWGEVSTRRKLMSGRYSAL